MDGVEDLSILEDVRSALFGRPPQALRVGRYEVGERIGHGGGGTIYRGHDPSLKRDVAIKFVRDEGNRARVLKEAQALARLSHPNVVQVYDVGQYAMGVFIAMELLNGQNIGDWLAAAPRSPAEILTTFLAAGEGLVAAHDAGLVHRDVKPTNIFLVDDGTVKLLDFGVAGASRDDGTHPDPTDGTRSLGGGTPWFMAPEQYRDHVADAKSDQYTLCFSLVEALCGRTQAADLAELQRRKLAGTVVGAWPPGVDRSTRTALLRGLDPDPTRRFESLRELLDAVRPRTRSRAYAAAALVVAAALLGAWSLSPATPLILHASLTSPTDGLPDADLARAQTLLEAGDTDAAAAICDDMLGAAEPADRARALLCRGRVERSGGDFRAAAEAFEAAFWMASDNGAMDVAARAAAQRAVVAVSLGNTAGGLEWVRHGEAALGRAHHEAAYVEADLAVARASASVVSGRYEDALPHYERALEIRTRIGGEQSRGAAAALKLVANCLQRMRRADEALPKHDTVVRTLESVLEGDHIELASALNDRATSLQAKKRYDDALADLDRALAITERLGLPEHPKVGTIRHNMGFSLRRLGRRPEALAQYRESLRIRLATHGPDHNKTLKTTNNLGQLLVELGQVEEGERLLLDALARYEAQGPHRLQRQVLRNLATAARARGDESTAAGYDQRETELKARLAQRGSK